MFPMHTLKKATSSFLIAALYLIPFSADHATAFEIISRSEWGAKAPVLEMVPHDPDRITIHHSAVRQKPKRTIATKLRSLQNFSQSEGKLADGRTKKAWADIPYHYFIDASGQVAEGRKVGFVGDTNTKYDPKGHIGIVLEGNFEVEHPDHDQKAALFQLLLRLSEEHGIPASAIGAHNHYASTACPGKHMTSELESIIQQVRQN